MGPVVVRELLVIRHAIAQQREVATAAGIDDAERPLTAAGEEKMAQACRGLSTLIHACDTLLCSPLRRAVQTAAIVQRHMDRPTTFATTAALAPGVGSNDCLHTLEQAEGERIAIIGHEPELGRLIATLLCGRGAAIILKKGGMALLRFETEIRPGNGELRWLLTPKQLRLLGK